MKLNLLERLFILNPLRPVLQRHLEARQLYRMGGPLRGGRVLEIGCGPGWGLALIDDLFGAGEIHAFDLDRDMVARARRRRLRRTAGTRLWVGNVRRIPVADATYDAVFNVGVLHHVVDWRAALGEVFRVLKPGGRFYCEEILRRYISHPVWGRLMKHPQHDRFDEADFRAALAQAGFDLPRTKEMGDLYFWGIADKPA
jgi:ubiquinone/menaquinone biosynthesis C-methylase UbiE